MTILGAPCLSFDIVRDSLGNDREDFPMTCYIVAGTQAEHAHTNNIVVMKMSNLTAVTKPKNDDDDSDSSSEDDDSSDEKDKEPVLDAALIKHPGTVNRIRVCNMLELFDGMSFSLL